MTAQPTDSDPREQKLSCWAQDLLADLRRRVRRAEQDAEAAVLATKPDQTDVLVYRYSEPNIGLPPGATILFKTGDSFRAYLQCRIEHTAHDGVRLVVQGGDSIQIRPHSDNHVSIRLRD